jgi:hypothetical protein
MTTHYMIHPRYPYRFPIITRRPELPEDIEDLQHEKYKDDKEHWIEQDRQQRLRHFGDHLLTEEMLGEFNFEITSINHDAAI